MNKLLALAGFSAALLPICASAQDMAVAQKWAAAKVVKYRVDGVHTARVQVVLGDYEGKADVTDRISVEFRWDAQKRKVVGAVALTEAQSETGNLKSDGTNCPPPALKAPYEHFQSASSAVLDDLIEIKGTRTYPAASVSNYPASCSMRAIPGGKQPAVVHLPIMAPETLAMPNMRGSPFTIAADRKSFTVKGAESWIWTYTPTLVE